MSLTPFIAVPLAVAASLWAAWRYPVDSARATWANAVAVALPTIATAFASAWLWDQFAEGGLWRREALAVGVVALLVAWTAISALYAERSFAAGAKKFRSFVTSSILLAAATVGMVACIAPVVAAEQQWSGSGRVELLVDGVSVSSTVRLGVSGLETGADPYEPRPKDSLLSVSGAPWLELQFEGEPGALARYALELGGDMSMDYESENAFTITDNEFVDTAQTYGRVDETGVCVPDPDPPRDIDPTLGMNRGSLIRGEVVLDERGFAEVAFSGLTEHNYAVLIGNRVEVKYPSVVVHTSSTACIVGTGPLDGEWIAPPRAIAQVYNQYFTLFGSSRSFETFPTDRYREDDGIWEIVGDPDERAARAGYWPNVHVLSPLLLAPDRFAETESNLRLFTGAALAAIVTSLILKLVDDWPGAIRRRRPPATAAPQQPPTTTTQQPPPTRRLRSHRVRAARFSRRR